MVVTKLVTNNVVMEKWDSVARNKGGHVTQNAPSSLLTQSTRGGRSHHRHHHHYYQTLRLAILPPHYHLQAPSRTPPHECLPHLNQAPPAPLHYHQPLHNAPI